MSTSSRRIGDECEDDESEEYRVDLIESREDATESLQPTKQQLIRAVPRPGPGQRRGRVGPDTEEIMSPVRPLGYEVAQRPMVEVGPDHYVRDFD